jgi:hypothetical protein
LHKQSVTFREAAGDIALLVHCRQALLPLIVLYSPAKHGAHGPALGPENPGKHWHAVIALDAVHIQLVDVFEPFGAKEFATQDVQLAFPGNILKGLTGQRSQKATFKSLRTL